MSFKTENADRNAKLAIVLKFVNLLKDCCNTEYELSLIYLKADGNGRPIDWLHRWSFCESIKDLCFSPMWRDVRIAVDGYNRLGKYLKDNLPALNDPVGRSFDWEISPESIVRNFKKLKEHLGKGKLRKMNILEAFQACAKSAKAAVRKALLLSADSDLVTAILADTYDKTRTYGITTKNLSIKGHGSLSIDTDYSRFHDVLDKCACRKLTGNAAIDAVTDTIQDFTKEAQQLLLDIIDRNIAIGISYDSWCKIAGIKRVKFEVPLAFHLDKAPGKPNPIDGTYFASHKLDGVRLLSKVDLDKKKATFFSRSGKEYTTLKNLEEPLLKVFAGKTGVWAVDGECCHLNADGSEDFQGIMKEVTRKNGYTIDNPHYCVFDAVPWDVFEEKTVSDDFTHRYAMLKALPTDEHIIILEQERVTTQKTYDKWLKRVYDNNWEGFMLRKDAPFRKGRTADLLKVKPYQDAEFTVVDYVAGKQTFAVPGKGNMEFDGVKDIIIELPCGDRVNVGGGLTKEQRIEWLKNPKLILGKTVTIKYLEETTDVNGKHSLRHPTLKYVYDGARNT